MPKQAQADQVWLKSTRDKSARQHHPWIFSGAIGQIRGNPADGSVVEVLDNTGEWLARGSINRRSQIAIRLLTWNPDEAIDTGFWRSRLAQAAAGRAGLASDPGTDAYRLVFAESDGLPGLIVDRYGRFGVIQFLSLGVEVRRDEIIPAAIELLGSLGVTGLYERSDVDVREKEGLPPRTGVLWGETPPAMVEIHENGLRFDVDVIGGQKTGFYLDQRGNRQIVRSLAAGREVLNGFAYTGGFGVYAAAGGATGITSIDESAPALRLALANLVRNGLAIPHEVLAADVFAELRRMRAAERQFDLIILDPPKFAHSQRQLTQAAHGYQDINRLACRLLRPDGLLVTFSCSGLVTPDLFQKIVFSASLEARREGQILMRLSQGLDHPIRLTFPEAEYLKGLVCRIV